MFARTELLKAAGIPSSTLDSDPRISRMAPAYKEQLQEGVKKLLIDEELRRRRYADIEDPTPNAKYRHLHRIGPSR